MWVDKRLPRLHERLVFAPTHGIERRGGHGRRRVAPTARSARILGKPEMLNPNRNRVSEIVDFWYVYSGTSAIFDV